MVVSGECDGRNAFAFSFQPYRREKGKEKESQAFASVNIKDICRNVNSYKQIAQIE